MTCWEKKMAKNKNIINWQSDVQKAYNNLSSVGKEGKESALYANDYFLNIKNNLSTLEDSRLIKEINMLPAYIEELMSIGQTRLAKKLKTKLSFIVKERVLLANGFSKYIHRVDITRYIELVNDKVVKCCELELFPRIIPNKPKELLKKAQKLNIFKDFWVVYTEYDEDMDLSSEEEKQIREKNRDPIIFGSLEGKDDDDLTNLYYICDWEDEFCDITFDKMINKLSSDDTNYKVNNITIDIQKYLNKICQEVENNSKKKKYRFIEKLKKIFKK